MIRDFADREAGRIWQGTPSRRLPGAIQPIARRTLRMLNRAINLDHLRIPPVDRLEALNGGRRGQHSIRSNDPWRNCFRGKDGAAHGVEIVACH